LSIAFGSFKRGYTIVGGDVNDFHAIKLLKFSA
jgi:predicted phage gp36 major capsid-like protein